MKWSGKDSALCAMASGELVTLQINEDRTSIDVNIYSQIRYTAYFFLNQTTATFVIRYTSKYLAFSK